MWTGIAYWKGHRVGIRVELGAWADAETYTHVSQTASVDTLLSEANRDGAAWAVDKSQQLYVYCSNLKKMILCPCRANRIQPLLKFVPPPLRPTVDLRRLPDFMAGYRQLRQMIQDMEAGAKRKKVAK